MPRRLQPADPVFGEEFAPVYQADPMPEAPILIEPTFHIGSAFSRSKPIRIDPPLNQTIVRRASALDRASFTPPRPCLCSGFANRPQRVPSLGLLLLLLVSPVQRRNCQLKPPNNRVQKSFPHQHEMLFLQT